jgi:hypothetical protein
MSAGAEESIVAPTPRDEPIFIVEVGAPPGFENLDLAQETILDISYGGRRLSPAPAIYTSESLRFTNAEAIVAEIHGLIFPDKIILSLSRALDPHSELICVEPGVPVDCGILDPENAGIIFDRSRFHAEIFVGCRNLRLTRAETMSACRHRSTNGRAWLRLAVRLLEHRTPSRTTAFAPPPCSPGVRHKGFSPHSQSLRQQAVSDSPEPD